MAERRFRFGLVSAPQGSSKEWLAQVQRAESMGFSTLLVPDALGVPSPFPALAAAAASTETLRFGSFVLAAPLRTAQSIAWDAATLDQLSGGRFELGLGAGRPDAKTERILGVPFGTPGERVRRVEHAIDTVRSMFAEAAEGNEELRAFQPVQRPAPPIMVAANGDRLLSVGARKADIVAVAVGTEADLREKVAVLREAAGDRFDDLELSVNVFGIGDTELPPWIRAFGIDPSLAVDNQLLPVLNGDTATAIDVLQRRRDEFGVSYITINAFALPAAAPIVEQLAGR